MCASAAAAAATASLHTRIASSKTRSPLSFIARLVNTVRVARRLLEIRVQTETETGEGGCEGPAEETRPGDMPKACDEETSEKDGSSAVRWRMGSAWK